MSRLVGASPAMQDGMNLMQTTCIPTTEGGTGLGGGVATRNSQGRWRPGAYPSRLDSFSWMKFVARQSQGMAVPKSPRFVKPRKLGTTDPSSSVERTGRIKQRTSLSVVSRQRGTHHQPHLGLLHQTAQTFRSAVAATACVCVSSSAWPTTPENNGGGQALALRLTVWACVCLELSDRSGTHVAKTQGPLSHASSPPDAKRLSHQQPDGRRAVEHRWHRPVVRWAETPSRRRRRSAIAGAANDRCWTLWLSSGTKRSFYFPRDLSRQPATRCVMHPSGPAYLAGIARQLSRRDCPSICVLPRGS